MLTWAFLFEDRDYFEGFRTLSTNGIDKPVLNVFRLLAKLGGTRLSLTCDRDNDPVTRGGADTQQDLPDISGIATIDETSGIQVFLGSHHDDWDVVTPSEVTVSVIGVEPNQTYRIYKSMVAAGSGNSYTAWDKAGRPPLPNREQLAFILKESRLSVESNGRGYFKQRMFGHHSYLALSLRMFVASGVGFYMNCFIFRYGSLVSA